MYICLIHVAGDAVGAMADYWISATKMNNMFIVGISQFT